MADKQVADKLFVLYHGLNPLRTEETDSIHGMVFEKGYVYEVSPLVFEFLKSRRGYSKVRGIKKGMTDFKPVKEHKPKPEVYDNETTVGK